MNKQQLHSGLVILAALLVTACVPARFSTYEAFGEGQNKSFYCVAGLKAGMLVEAP